MEESTQAGEGIKKLIFENRERLKELSAINEITGILKANQPIEETLQQICMVLPIAWQYPEDTVARIRYNGKIYKTNDFKETQWVQLQTFKTIDNNKGLIEVYIYKRISI